MVRLILFLLAVVALASGLAWLADRPGNLLIHWQGYEVETSVFRAVVLLAAVVGLVVLVWSILRQLWNSPAAIGRYVLRRRQKRGLEALSSGMIAIGAGDRAAATRYALQARRSLPNEPLTHLLRAQAAQITGDRPTARRVFEAMLGSPDTEQLGLRGLYLEAEREGEVEAARQFAERALRLNPKLAWPAESLFDLQCKQGDWDGALATLATARRNGHIEKASADRRRAVLLTAQAQAAEDSDPERTLTLSLEAHALAPDLVPPAAIAARLLASRGNTPRATKVVRKTWSRAPHPDLATAYAYARLGDSPHDRLDRIKQLAALNPYALESPIAVANAAVEARDFEAARQALAPLLDGRITRRVCLLMARIEGEAGDKGRVREWLARAVNAPRDPAWTADGVVAEHWAPTSPVTGALDAFQWRVPVETLERSDGDLLARKIEELVALAAPAERVLEAAPGSERAPAPPSAAEPSVEEPPAAASREAPVHREEGEEKPRPVVPAPIAAEAEPEADSKRTSLPSATSEVVIVPPVRQEAAETVALPAPGKPDGKGAPATAAPVHRSEDATRPVPVKSARASDLHRLARPPAANAADLDSTEEDEDERPPVRAAGSGR